MTFAFNDHTERLGNGQRRYSRPRPTMDHRGLLVTRNGLVIVGGMEKGQQVTAKVTVVKPDRGK